MIPHNKRTLHISNLVGMMNMAVFVPLLDGTVTVRLSCHCGVYPRSFISEMTLRYGEVFHTSRKRMFENNADVARGDEKRPLNVCIVRALAKLAVTS